jgi:kynurenine formamidase
VPDSRHSTPSAKLPQSVRGRTRPEPQSRAVDALLELLASSTVVDLSHSLEEHMPMWPGQSRYFHTLWDSYWHGDPAVDYQILLNEHTGTHVDAPAHFIKDEVDPRHLWVDEVPLGALVGRAAVLDFADVGEDGVVTAEMVRQWERRETPLRKSDIVLFNVGWAKHWHPRPADRQYGEHWPSLSADCARLMRERKVGAVGTDTLSPDAHGTTEFPVHRVLLRQGVLIIENLTRLAQLPPVCFFLGLPLKIKQGSGSPLRAIALIPRPLEGTSARKKK